MINFDALKTARKISVTYVNNPVDKEYVKQFRKVQGLTQIALANIMGVKKKTIEKWEQGKNKVTGSSSILFYLYSDDPELINKVRCVKKVFNDVEEEFQFIETEELAIKNEEKKFFYTVGNLDCDKFSKKINKKLEMSLLY